MISNRYCSSNVEYYLVQWQQVSIFCCIILNYIAVLCGMSSIQYSAESGSLSVQKLFTSCIRRWLVLHACDWVMSALSAVLLIFSFQCSLFFFHVDQPGSTLAYLFSPISVIGRCREFGKYVSCTERTFQENNFELILTVKWKLDIP